MMKLIFLGENIFCIFYKVFIAIILSGIFISGAAGDDLRLDRCNINLTREGYFIFSKASQTVLYLHHINHHHPVHHHGLLRVEHHPRGLPGWEEEKKIPCWATYWWRRYKSHISDWSLRAPVRRVSEWEVGAVLEDDNPDLHQHDLHHLQHPRLALLHPQRLHLQPVWLRTSSDLIIIIILISWDQILRCWNI